MLLTGHTGPVSSISFNNDGSLLASAANREIYCWSITNQCKNVLNIPQAHKAPITRIKWTSNGRYIVTSSADKTVRVHCPETGERIKQMKGHSTFVNDCDTSPENENEIVSVSDDCTAKLWDLRVRGATISIKQNYSLTATAFAKDGKSVIVGGIDNNIYLYDVRKPTEPSLVLMNHQGTITGLAISCDGSYLLSNAMDDTLFIWDIRPYVETNRCVKLFSGHQTKSEQQLLRCGWHPNGHSITAGSADRFVYVWGTEKRNIIYKLPGHRGAVLESCFHPTHPLIASCSLDKTIYIGELYDLP